MKTEEKLTEKFGIEIEAQPQFINIWQEDKYLIINTNWIKKIEPAGEQVLITLINERLPPLSINIQDLIKVLPNVKTI